MKNFFKNRSKPVFKPSIFGEGMRQLRLLGVLYTAVCVIVAFFNFFDSGVYGEDFQKQYVTSGSVSMVFVVLIAICSTVFLLAASLCIMQFMRAAKARDFYCSTPNSVGTVWLNFAAAVYAWNLIGLLAGHVIMTVLMMTQDIKIIGMCLQAFAGSFTLSLLVFGIVMLSVTLTGRMVNVIATTVGLAFLPSAMWIAFHSSLNNYFSRFNFLKYPEGLTCPDPFSMLLDASVNYNLSMYSVREYRSVFYFICSGSAILYCLVLGAFYFAAAFLFASIRTGDTAGRPFVNKAAHLISLLSINVPIACMVADIGSNLLNLRTNNYDVYYDVPETIVEALSVIIVVLALYWLAELMFTFDIRHSHRAYRYLPVPVLVAAMLFGLGYAKFSAEMTTTVKPDEVDSFTLVRNGSLDDSLAVFRMRYTYGRIVTDNARFRDAQIIDYVTSHINTYVDSYKANPSAAYRQMEDVESYDGDEYEEYEYGDYEYEDLRSGQNYINIRLNLKNGKTVTRSVRFDDPQVKQLEKAIVSDKAFMNEFLTLPKPDKLNINVDTDGLSGSEAEEVYNALVDEYNAMTDEQKLNYLKSCIYSDYNDEEDSERPDYVYDDPDNAEVEEISQTELAEAAEKEGLLVSFTDIKLVSKTLKAGEYVIDECDYYTGSNDLGDYNINVTIGGYADGHLFDDYYDFYQYFRVNLKQFPRTHALIVKICNAKIPEAVDFLESVEQVASKHSKDNWMNSASLVATYHSKDTFVSMRYDLVTDAEITYYSDYNSYWRYDDYPVSYHEETDSYQKRTIKTIEVDSQAMAKKLLSDAVATGESVDFSKPYCVLEIHAYRHGKEAVYRTFFVQTDFETM